MNSSTDLSAVFVKNSSDININCYVNEAVDLDRADDHRKSRISHFDTFETIMTSLEQVDSGDEVEDLHLISTSSVAKKDFRREVRAVLDIKHYLDKMTIVLNRDSPDLYSLVKDLLERMRIERKEKLDMNEALESVFTDIKHKLPTKRIQGIVKMANGSTVIDQSWICLLGSVVSVSRRLIGFVKTSRPLNLGSNAQEVRFVLVILSPTIEKSTKNSFEIGRTFGTVLSDREIRYDLQNANQPSMVRNLIKRKSRELSETDDGQRAIYAFSGLNTNLWENITRRLKCYPRDITDGLVGNKTVHKTLATTLFLYFSCLLPAIAFGVLNSRNTNGLIGAERALIGQAIGGIIFAVIGGQPLVIIATTALVSLYIKVVYEISQDLGVDFFVMYASVGFWNTIFVLIYAVGGWSKLIRFSTRSVEEIFAQFITVCFFFDAINDLVKSFQEDYFAPGCENHTISAMAKGNFSSTQASSVSCGRESSLLFLILMLGTLWLSLRIYKFNRSPYLPREVREFVADYALPIGVIGFSFIGSHLFSAVKVEKFDLADGFSFQRADVDYSSWKVVGISIGLGFALSLLFFMDQNITGQIVNAPNNHLKKGSAPHLDLLAIAVINCLLSFYGIPWMHGVLPQSPLHVRCLADVEERNNRGCIEQVIIRVRETRLTGLLANVLIGFSMFMVPYPLDLIPVPVLDGLFLYCAFASLRGSSFFERLCLLFQEQATYPPNHYIRNVRQRIVHFFTILELVQLGLLCFVGFAPWAYLRMAFPVFIALLIPIRHLIIPWILDEKILTQLDSYG